MQVDLPGGYRYQGKLSRCVCYTEDAQSAGPRSATRSQAQALACAQTWSFEWWAGLSKEEQACIEELDGESLQSGCEQYDS